MERRTSSVVMETGQVGGNAPRVDPGSRDVAVDPAAARARLPYPVSLAMPTGDERSLREAARRLVEGAV